MDKANEKKLIENYALRLHYIKRFKPTTINAGELEIRTFKPYINRGRSLELGCEIGYMSELIAPLVDCLDVVDGSEEFIQQAKKRNIPNANYRRCSI